MASRTQIVCLCEGERGSIDAIFINRLLKSLAPSWVRPHGSNIVRLVPCGNRSAVVERVPAELGSCLGAGSDTTLMVWADCDDDCADGDALQDRFWREAQRRGVSREDFERAVFVFAKDRLENWIQFLLTGSTDESIEGPSAKKGREVAQAARNLAKMCQTGQQVSDMPPSLQWSCRNWRALGARMSSS